MKTMGRIKYIAVTAAILCVALVLNSCNDKLIRLQHDIKGKPITFELPAIPVAGNFDFTQQASLDLQSQLDSLHISLFELSAISVKEVTVTIEDTSLVAPVTFDVLDNVYFKLQDKDRVEHLMAYKDPVPHNGSQSLKLDANGSLNLLPYANGDEIAYRISGKSNKPVLNKMKLTVNVVYHIVVDGPF